MKRKNWLYVIILPIIFFVGMILSSCCSPKDCVVTVTFVGVDEDLGWEDYSFAVTFNEPTTITLEIPEGYDHTQVKTTINDVEQEGVVEFEKDVTDEYKYSINKTITYTVKNTKRSFEYVVDVTTMPKLQFNLTLEQGMEGFKVVTVPEENLKRLTVLNQTKTKYNIAFENNVASVKYGEYAFLIHTMTADNRTLYSSLYTDENHFTLDKYKKNIGTINYAQYDVSKKGNGRYYYNGSNETSIFYIGKIMEDTKFYASIPNYEPDKGFPINKDPNVFYLFSYPSAYNSEMFTIESFTSTTSTYDSNNANMDKLDNVTLTKVDHAGTYNDRYDIHQIYLGSDLDSDSSLTSDKKADIRKDLYFRISSSIGVENIDFKLLHYEREYRPEYELTDIVTSQKGYKYLKISHEDLMEFSLQRDAVNSAGQVNNYHSGSAILYPHINAKFLYEDRNNSIYKYTKIFLKKEFTTLQRYQSIDDYNMMVYLKDDQGNKIYGFIDYHQEGGHIDPRDCVYFETADLFDSNEKYKNSLYCDVWSKEYIDYNSCTIRAIDYYTGYYSQSSLTPITPIKVTDPKIYNGYNEFPIYFRAKEPSDSYTVGTKIHLNGEYMTSEKINFSQMNLGANIIYLTNNVLFEEVSDFNTVRDSNKDTYNSTKFSLSQDVYYFVRDIGQAGFDFDIYLDPNDRSTKISSCKILCDIVGEPLKLDINGEPYVIKVLLQDVIYETIDGNVYALQK